jgi:transcription initiation factor TFIIIB Brf1 subunit/transcription initiation factor TFIIB
LKCPKCSGTAVSPEGLGGEKVCTNCGLVIDDPLLAFQFSKWVPKWPSNYSEEDSDTLREWLTNIRIVSCQLNLPNFPYAEEAARTIRKENGFFFRYQRLTKNKRETIAALVHLILREYGKERSIKEICEKLSLDNRLVLKQAWTLKKKFITTQQFQQNQKRSPEDYLYKYGCKITSNNHLLIKAKETLVKIQPKGGNPISLAAGALYHACKADKVRISKKNIGKTFCISHRTVDTNERRIRRILSTTVLTKQVTK